MPASLVEDPKTTRPVPESLWRDAPEYFSRFIPRIHRDSQLCDDATIQCRIDIVGKDKPFVTAGNLCLHAGNLIALTMPDCIPERLALSAYLIEAGFVYDGVKHAELDGEAGATDAQNTPDKTMYEIDLRNKQVLSKMAVQVMKHDRQLGEDVISGWATWKKGEEVILPKTTGKSYQHLDEYLPDRFDDIGWPMVLNLLHWGTGVVVDEASAKEIAPILRPIHHVVTLTNDYFSWEKEIAEHIELNETTPLINAVAFYMKWDSLSAAGGKAAVKAKIEQLEEEYSVMKDEYIARHGGNPPPAVLRWFSIMEAVVAGNLIWSNFTPRYHVADLKADEYEEYYARRVREGALFFDSCTDSDDFVVPTNDKEPSKLRRSPRRSIGASRESSRVRNGALEKSDTSQNRQEQNATIEMPTKTSRGRKRRASADATRESAAAQVNHNHIDSEESQQKKRKSTSISRDGKEKQTGTTSKKTNGHVNHHRIDVPSGPVNGEKATPSVHYRQPRLPDLPQDIVDRPYNYVESLPSKGVRSMVLEALNSWYLVPEAQMKQIDSIVRSLHNASLMIDDIQDETDLRRGKPATHVVFGIGQTINSAYFQCIETLNLAHSASPGFFDIVMDEFRTGHVGQSLDLYWTFDTVIPTEKEYLQMVDAKTSSLFRLCSRLLRSAATTNKELEIEDMATLFGRYFQIRDDHKNLSSQEYTDQKGFCSDLDEGKYSLPIIHALRKRDPELESKLLQRLQPDGLSMKSKKWILNRLSEKGSLEYTSKRIDLLHKSIDECMATLEEKTGTINWMLRRILSQLAN